MSTMGVISKLPVALFALCAAAIMLGCPTTDTVTEQQDLDAVDLLYNEVVLARQTAINANAAEYDAPLFTAAEADYEQGAAFYAVNDERAGQNLSNALAKYNQLIALADSSDLRSLAELEYERAVQRLIDLTDDVSLLRDALLKEGIVPAAGELGDPAQDNQPGASDTAPAPAPADSNNGAGL